MSTKKNGFKQVALTIEDALRLKAGDKVMMTDGGPYRLLGVPLTVHNILDERNEQADKNCVYIRVKEHNDGKSGWYYYAFKRLIPIKNKLRGDFL